MPQQRTTVSLVRRILARPKLKWRFLARPATKSPQKPHLTDRHSKTSERELGGVATCRIVRAGTSQDESRLGLAGLMEKTPRKNVPVYFLEYEEARQDNTVCPSRLGIVGASVSMRNCTTQPV